MTKRGWLKNQLDEVRRDLNKWDKSRLNAARKEVNAVCPMEYKRWHYLETNIDAKLTKEEIEEGWHWCCEFDYLLVGPGMQEMEYCLCFEGDEDACTHDKGK